MATHKQKLEQTKKRLALARDLPGLPDDLLDALSYIWSRLEQDVIAEKMPRYASCNKIAKIACMAQSTAKRRLDAARIQCIMRGNRHIYNTKEALAVLTK